VPLYVPFFCHVTAGGQEDGDVAALDSTWSMGGNAANTACMLADLLHADPLGWLQDTPPEERLSALFMGSLADDDAQRSACTVHQHTWLPITPGCAASYIAQTASLQMTW